MTGGTQWIPYTILDSTELSVNEGAWSTLPPSGNLPTPTTSLRGVSLNKNVEKWIPKSSILPIFHFYH